MNDIKRIFEKCLKDHPRIVMYDGILGGTPHIQGTRMGVACILGKLYTYRGVDGLREQRPDIPEADILEALAFAQDAIALAGLAAVDPAGFERAFTEDCELPARKRKARAKKKSMKPGMKRRKGGSGGRDRSH